MKSRRHVPQTEVWLSQIRLFIPLVRWSLVNLRWKWIIAIQYTKFEKIVAKHWPIWGMIAYWVQYFQIAQNFFRKAPSLQDGLAPGVVDLPKTVENKLFRFFFIFYACSRCATCKHTKNNIKRRKDFSLSVTHKQYQMRFFITCATVGVVLYMLKCDCSLRYVWSTSRALHVQVG